MLNELIAAFQVGKEVYDKVNKTYQGNHFDAVVKAEALMQALDVNDKYTDCLHEVLDVLSVIDDSDRAYVKAAAYYYRACCYYDLADYVRARQNIAFCLSIKVDSFTLEKDLILDFQARASELKKVIHGECTQDTTLQSCEDDNSVVPFNMDFIRQFPNLDRETIHTVLEIIFKKLDLNDGMELCDMSPDDNIGEDYGADYLDFVEIVIALEGVLDVGLPALNVDIEEFQCTVADVLAAIDDAINYKHSASTKQEQSIDTPTSKNDEPIYLRVDKVEPIHYLGGSVLCTVSTSRAGYLKTSIYEEGVDEVVVINPSGMSVIAKTDGIDKKIGDSFEYIGVGEGTFNNFKVNAKEPLRIRLLKIKISDVEIGAKIYIKKEYAAVHPILQNEKPKELNPHNTPYSIEQEYLNELKECITDGEISPRERRLLDKLASKLGITPARAMELEASLSAPSFTDDEKEYLEEVKAVLEDGAISDKERRLLEKLRKMYDISESRAKELEEYASR